MSFRVTQCPACESTFSTNPRVLGSAAGKVRCGACLTIFEAAENFLDTGFDREAENESVFVGNSAQDYFDPSSFLTRQSLQESLPQSPPQPQRQTPSGSEEEAVPDAATIPAPDAATRPEPRLAPDDPETPDYLFLDSAEPAVDAGGAAHQTGQVAPEEEEFLALVADSQAPPPDPAPAAPAAELLAAGGYPALVEIIEALLEQPQEPLAVKITKPTAAGFPAAGGYPALEEVITDLLEAPAPPDVSTEVTVPDVPFPAGAAATTAASQDAADSEHSGEPGSLPLFPEEASPQSPPEHDTPEAALTPPGSPASPPEAFQLYARFSLSAGGYALPAKPETDRETIAESHADLAKDLEQEFNAALNEADFRETLARDMDSAPSEQPDIELASDPERAADSDSAIAAPEGESAEPDQSVAAIRARALHSDLQDEDGLEAIPRENLASLGEFATPVEILTGRQGRIGKQLAWASLALLAAILLTGQYLWQETTRFAQMASVRPVYEWTCGLLGCQLPVYSDIDAIQSSNLVVRSHPELDNALMVSVEFRNTASFAQPFPIMVLSFNSASNSVIALREFAPEDYLPPALRSRSLLPPQAPVQVNLELLDPGEDAVNYTLAFRRP